MRTVLAAVLASCLAVAGCGVADAPVGRPQAHPAASGGDASGPPVRADAILSAALDDGPPPFYGRSSRLSDRLKSRMRGVSWRRGCPIPLRDLRLLRMSFWRFSGEVDRGRMVVNKDVAADVLEAFRTMYDRRFKVRRMRLIEHYGGDDDRSMAANNTSAFNCRYVKATTRWSMHSYGRAIDINPVQNPYVSGSFVDPPAGERYLNRKKVRKGMVVEGGKVTDAFDAIGWGWGGRWRSAKDYQHFSRSGR